MQQKLGRFSYLAGLVLPAVLFGDVGLQAQDSGAVSPRDEDNVVIVTATRIRQGGAQDIKQFRSVSLDGAFLPRPESLTIEGLLGEHDLTLPSKGECEELFCISGHAMQAALAARPQDEYFAGLGFESNLESAVRQSEPLSLVAVVDKSGSMTGTKIERAKEALLVALAKMGDRDRFGIVVFGSTSETLLPVMDIGPNRQEMVKAIEAIYADGSTDMESGLRLGFQNAFAEHSRANRKTRIMLFTDEQPNVGNIDPQGFMGQAIAGSKRGVGLTTIGVGRDFDNALALQLS
ncbi:MAG: VWA domain-containing protein, partial [Pontixanthobacter sp.]